MLNKSLFSSKKSDWETPHELFDALNKEFRFTLDVCASDKNAKCINYLTPKTDFLKWMVLPGERCFMNPPYGRQIGKFIKHAYMQSQVSDVFVCLLPARVDTSWWHNYIQDKAEVRFIRGRLKFVGAQHSAPFPSCIVIYRRRPNDS